jgi:hypothetical protein
MKTILDPSFRYTASFNTDLRKTFAKIRRSQRKDEQKATAPAASANVASIVRKSAAART